MRAELGVGEIAVRRPGLPARQRGDLHQPRTTTELGVVELVSRPGTVEGADHREDGDDREDPDCSTEKFAEEPSPLDSDLATREGGAKGLLVLLGRRQLVTVLDERA